MRGELKWPHRDQRAVSNPRVQILLANPFFDVEVDKIRVTWNIDRSINPDEYERGNDESYDSYLERMMNDVSFTNDIAELRKKFKLHRGWTWFLEEYVLTGSSSIDPDKGERIRLAGDDEQNNGEAVTEHIKSTYKYSDLRGRRLINKPWQTLQRDKAVYNLARKGKTIKEIAAIILSEFGDDLDYGHIKKIVSDYPKKLRLPPSMRVRNLRTG